MTAPRSVRGFTFAEIVVAVAIVTIVAVPVYYLLTNTKVGTAKAINYLRAMELANEVIEWANITPYEKLWDGIKSPFAQGYSDSLVVAGTTPKATAIQVSANTGWKDLATKLEYSEQYNSAFFYRKVEIKPVAGVPYQGYLLEVTVTVSWNEGKAPAIITDPADRMRKITLSCLLMHERKMDY